MFDEQHVDDFMRGSTRQGGKIIIRKPLTLSQQYECLATGLKPQSLHDLVIYQTAVVFVGHQSVWTPVKMELFVSD